MPGCSMQDINLEVDGQVVRVHCDYKTPPEFSGDQIKWHRAGRPFGSHQRSLRFPESWCVQRARAARAAEAVMHLTHSRPSLAAT